MKEKQGNKAKAEYQSPNAEWALHDGETDRFGKHNPGITSHILAESRLSSNHSPKKENHKRKSWPMLAPLRSTDLAESKHR